MKPIQVYLGEADLRHLDAVSREHGWTKSETVRIALRGLRERRGDALLSLNGMIRGLPRDLVTRFDEYLTETFDARPPEKARRARRRPRARR